MKIIHSILAAGLGLASTVHAMSALTLADFAPAALPGHAFTFHVEGGDALPAPTGTWTASFSSTSVTISDFPGVTGSHTSGWTEGVRDSEDSYTYDIAPSPAFGGKAANLRLWVSVPGARFYLLVDGVGSYGGVSPAAMAVAPIIQVQSGSKSLGNGSSTLKFPAAEVGKSGTPRKITIKNTGSDTLKIIGISKSGSHRGDFLIAPPAKTSIRAGGSATFSITFKPKAKGTRKAVIAIASNDKDDSPFLFKVTGSGL